MPRYILNSSIARTIICAQESVFATDCEKNSLQTLKGVKTLRKAIVWAIEHSKMVESYLRYWKY